MGIRLNKAANNLNIGVQTAVGFLKTHHVGELSDNANPNTKITDEQYNALVREFSSGKRVKEKAGSLFIKTDNRKLSDNERKKKKKKAKSSKPIELSIETKLKWAEQRKNRRSLRPNKTFKRDESPNTIQRKDIRAIKVISSTQDIDEALASFTWPTLAYDRSNDWYVQDLIGKNEELMSYYHTKMKGYFGLDHVLKKEFRKKEKVINVRIQEDYKPKAISTEPIYREVWLPQPLASMVVRGLTSMLNWHNISDYRYGEKVLVYAQPSTRRSRKIIWSDDELYSNYHNALQMGNLYDKEMPTHVYVGYITIGKKNNDGQFQIQEVNAFETVTSISSQYLHKLGTDKRQFKTMSLENRALKIPVNDDVWPMLEHRDGTFYFYWKKSFDEFYSEEYGCGDSNGLYEVVLYNDKQEKVCAQEDKAAIAKETYVSEPDNKEFEAFVINFKYIREKSKFEESSFNVMKRIEWILDWNCVKFKSGYFVVFPPEDGKVKFKPKAFPYRGVSDSFNYLKEYLNDRLNPIRCYVETLDLTIYDKITLEAAIQKFAVLSRQRGMKSNATKTTPKEVPEQMTFKQALSKAAQMTPEEFEKYKSEHINHLVKLQSKKYKVIPCVERLSHANNDMTEYAFMFSIECRSRNILIVHENVNPDRSTLLFWVKEAAYDKAIREIYDFLQSAEINKRSSLRDGSIDVGNAGIIKYKSINHDDLWSWKRAIKVHTVGYYINI